VHSYLYGKQRQNCGKHCHSKYCSKHKDIDLAALQSEAFQFMVLQKPAMEIGAIIPDAPLRASFYPTCTMSP
jgi:hypothetical protein